MGQAVNVVLGFLLGCLVHWPALRDILLFLLEGWLGFMGARGAGLPERLSFRCFVLAGARVARVSIALDRCLRPPLIFGVGPLDVLLELVPPQAGFHREP